MRTATKTVQKVAGVDRMKAATASWGLVSAAILAICASASASLAWAGKG